MYGIVLDVGFFFDKKLYVVKCQYYNSLFKVCMKFLKINILSSISNKKEFVFMLLYFYEYFIHIQKN